MIPPILAESCISCPSIVFFFLMLRPPPRSTLFPTRRSSDLDARGKRRCIQLVIRVQNERHIKGACGQAAWPRSEEHTSELQSHVNLVCRLLLEKKNKSEDDAQSPYDMERPSPCFRE